MNERQKPGICIDSIYLLKCRAVVLDLTAMPQFNLGLTHLQRTEEKNKLSVIASFDMMSGVEKPVCTLTCTFAALYTREDDSAMTWPELSDPVVVAHMVPYVREFVSSVTLRMPVKPLVLQPTNAHLLVEEYRATQSSAAPATPVGPAS